MDKKTIITIVLAILLVIAVVQTVQLVSIKSKLSSGTAIATVNTAAGAPSTGTGTGLDSLPQGMVGGC